MSCAPGASGWALPGRRFRAAQPIWEIDLRSPSLAYLSDHVVGDAPILPGAAIVSMGLGVGRSLRGGDVLCVEQVELLRMVALDPQTGPLVQCRADAWGPGVEIHTSADSVEW